jgi:hypothetical protein
MGRFLSQKDMSAARHEQEVHNSLIKRGEMPNADQIVRSQHVVCGCGAEGCIFISNRRETPEQLEFDKKHGIQHYY